MVRSNIAVLNAATGEATAWRADANDTVLALAVTSDRVYAGGIFRNISGADRNRIAALASDSGAALDWNPGVSGRANSAVNVILPLGSRVMIGGVFTNVGGALRNSLAAVDATSGQVSSWDPNVQAQQATTSASVLALLLAGDLLYVGGDFVRVAGQVRPRIAVVSPATGQPTAWTVNATNIVNALGVSGSTVYAGGTFTNFGGQIRNRLAGADTITAQVSAWNPDASGQAARIYSLALLGGRAYIGGQFTTLGGEFRNRIGSVDLANGRATPWDPNLDALVRTVQITPDAVYVRGDFLRAGGRAQSYFAVFSNQPFFHTLSAANGQFNASIRTGEGQRLRVQTSTDLSQWTEVTIENAGTEVLLDQPMPDSPRFRFYRALLESTP